MKQKFLDCGYKLYEQDNKEFLQKCIRDKFGKKYFINVNIHDLRDFGNTSLPDFLYDADVQFNTIDAETFNVRLLEAKNPEQIEKFFENVWKNLDCEYYDAE